MVQGREPGRRGRRLSHRQSGTGDSYPGMDVRIIQKDMPIPAKGFVVNVETLRQDIYQNDGVFNQSNLDYIFADCRRDKEAPNAAMLFHAAFIQGITNASGMHRTRRWAATPPTAEDRGVRFYYKWGPRQRGPLGVPPTCVDRQVTLRAKS